jgi:hypothetical protein
LNGFRKEQSTMLLAKKIKLHLSEEDAKTLEFMQGKCRGLYNCWVMKLRDGERWNFAQAKRTLQESKKHDPELSQVLRFAPNGPSARRNRNVTSTYRRSTSASRRRSATNNVIAYIRHRTS